MSTDGIIVVGGDAFFAGYCSVTTNGLKVLNLTSFTTGIKTTSWFLETAEFDIGFYWYRIESLNERAPRLATLGPITPPSSSEYRIVSVPCCEESCWK